MVQGDEVEGAGVCPPGLEADGLAAGAGGVGDEGGCRVGGQVDVGLGAGDEVVGRGGC